jgi:hypothetical protein
VAAKKRRIRWGSIIILILIGLLVFNRENIYYKLITITGISDYHLENILTDDIDLKDAYIDSNNLFLLGNGSLSKLNYEGNSIWVKSIDMANLSEDMILDKLLTIDKINGHMVNFDQNGEISSSNFGLGEIYSIDRLNEDLLIFLKKSNKLIFTDEKFQNLAQIKPLNGEIITNSMSINGPIIVTLSNEANDIKSFINFYDLSGIISSYLEFKGEVIYKIFSYNENFIKLTDRSIDEFTKDGEVVRSFPLTINYDSFFELKNGLAIKQFENETSTFKIFNFDEFTFSDDIIIKGNMKSFEDTSYGYLTYDNKSLLFYSNKGKLKMSKSVEFDFTKAIIVKDYIFVFSNSKYILYRILG